MSDLLDRAEKLRLKGQLKEAETPVRKLLRKEPRNADAWLCMAKILAARREGEAAEQAYQKAITLSKDPFEARVNLGILFSDRNAWSEAVDQLRQALVLRPNHAAALSNLGGMLRISGALNEAADVLSRSLSLAPDNAAAHTNIGLVLSALGRHEEAVAHLSRAVEITPGETVFHNNLLLYIHYSSEVSVEQIAEAHRRYGRAVETSAAAVPTSPRDLNPQRMLRIGYVSSDLRRHSVAFFLEPLLEHRDKSAFQLFAYSSTLIPDEVTVRFREYCDVFRDVAKLDDRALEAQIREDAIDILIDLSGHTQGNRLGVFVKKPAPIQITYLGYPDTTGLTAMDYRLTDAWADPEGMTEGLHTERLLRMPGGFLCYRPPTPSPPLVPPPCLGGAPPTFGSFNALAKISDKTLHLWARLLAEVPEARLRIKQSYLSQAESKKSFEEHLVKHGIDLARVQIWGHLTDLYEHLNAYQKVDVALDTYPYAGTTTTCEALWMGVPVVSLAGQAHVSRVGVSLLTRVGLADLVASSEDEYIRIASALIRDRARLSDFRQHARARAHELGLTDGPRAAASFEALLRAVYHNYIETVASLPALASSARGPVVSSLPKLPDETSRFFSLPGGIYIAAPSNFDQATSYVLEEQGDWYEDEIHFVRALLSGGETVLDVGANHGVYALSMARSVGPSGRVLAFEPSNLVAERLRASARANGFSHLSVFELAASNREGKASFYEASDSERSSLHPPREGQGVARSVLVSTLDRVAQKERFGKVSFIKLAVEGEEGNAIEGALKLIENSAPLLMVERKHGDVENQGLVEKLTALGFDIYRLLPGLNVLSPHPPGTDTDPYLLNLFAAQPARAERLSKNGLLAGFVADDTRPQARASWQEALAHTTLAGRVEFRDGLVSEEPAKGRYRKALERFALSQRKDIDLAIRAMCLRTALELTLASIEDPYNLSRLMTLARLAWAWGRRAIALEALGTAVTIVSSGKARIDEPFIPPCPRYDAVDIGPRLGSWAASAILEQYERLNAFSSFYATQPADVLKRLQTLASLGYQNPEMARRLVLIRRRMGQ